MGSQLCPATLIEGETVSLDVTITRPPKLVLQQGKHQVSRKSTETAGGLQGPTGSQQCQLVRPSSPKDNHYPAYEPVQCQTQLPSQGLKHLQEFHQIYSQFQLPDKTIFKGITVGGIPNGHGQEHHPDGQVYVGLFVNGEKNGKGKCTFNNSEEYEGEFKGNMMHGRGTYRFANGDVYVGVFVSNIREGLGRYTPKQPNEHGIEYYQGQYRQNQRDGKGFVRYIKGQVLKGIWKNGLLLRSI